MGFQTGSISVLLLAICVIQVTSYVCKDKKSDCANYGAYACTGIYEGWAKSNCRRFCRFCTDKGIPSGTKCTANNKRYANGERFICGCSECVCKNGPISCTDVPKLCNGFIGPRCGE